MRMKKHPPLLAILKAMVVRRYDTAGIVQTRSMASLEAMNASIRQALTLITPTGHASVRILCCFHRQHVEMGTKQKDGL